MSDINENKESQNQLPPLSNSEVTNLDTSPVPLPRASEKSTEIKKEEYKPKRKPFKNNKLKHQNSQHNKNNHRKNNSYNQNKYLPKDDTSEIEENTNSSYDPFNKENTLFSYIHQKTGFNPSTFWILLNELLAEKELENIKNYGGMSLIPSIILYGKEEIYPKIMELYSSKITKEEFENFLFPLSMNKNPLFMETTISFYDKLYKSDSEFIKKLITQASKMSYRKEPNIILLNWIDKNITENQEHFWNSCLIERNVILFEQALNFENLKKYLQKNYIIFETLIEDMGKTHTTKSSFGKKHTVVELINKDDKIKEEKNNTEALKQDVENLKEEVQGKTEIIRKRKKVLV